MRPGFTVAAAAVLGLVWGLWPSEQRQGQAVEKWSATHSATVKLDADHSEFGGISAVEMRDVGASAISVSDRGQLWSITFERENGVLVAAHADPIMRLMPRNVAADQRDSEGLALLDKNRIAVSFEGRHRVAIYGLPIQPVTGFKLAKPSRVLPYGGNTQLGNNKGLEALAIDSAGKLHAIPEADGSDGPVPVLRWQGTQWLPIAEVPRLGRFRVVGADFGPDGRLYILERDFAWVGFRSRLRSFRIAMVGLTDERHHMTSRLSQYDNLEGVSVWRDPQGQLRATMVSDDNLIPVQVSQVVEYILTQ
jgi:hypothetical protein